MKCGVPFVFLFTGFGLGQFPRTTQIALLSKPDSRALIQTTIATNADSKKVTGEPDIEIVRHQKTAGEGYVSGSPLYNLENGIQEDTKPEDKTEEDGKQTLATKKVSKGDELPISTTVKCLLNLLIQYFILYTALAIIRTYNQVGRHGYTNAQRICDNAIRSVNYAPMLCVLFLGTRMRAIQLAQGDTEKYHLPQPWVQTAMLVATWAVLAKAIISIMMGLMGLKEKEEGETIPLEQPAESEGQLVSVFTIFQYLAMAGLYGGFIAVVVGAIRMEAPREIWGDDAPPVSPAVNNTINLGAQYFIVVLILELYLTKEKLTQKKDSNTSIWKLAKETVQLAPMLCVMFLAVRQRALQMDPKNGNPQGWAQNCMFLCSYSVLIQTVLVVLVSLCGGECKSSSDEIEGDVKFIVKDPTVKTFLDLIRWILMIVLYVSFILIAISPFLLTMKGKPAPPISPALCNVLILVVQYFVVYLCLWLSILYRQNDGGKLPLQIFDAAKSTVMYCPMMAILFVAARMRSGQIGLLGGVEAAPQRYAQEAMHLSTWALFVQLVMVILVGILNKEVKTDADGNVIVTGTSVWHKIIEFFRYLCLISLYGGIVAVLIGIFTMDVESVNMANRSGGGLIPGVKVPALGDVAQTDMSKLNSM